MLKDMYGDPLPTEGGRRAKKNVNLREEGSDDDEEDGDKEEGAKRPGGRLLPKGLVDFGDSGDDGSD